MAGSQNTRRAAPANGLQQWFSNPGDRLEELRRQAEARGRQIYEEAIRRGKPVVADTLEDIRALGAKAIELQKKAIAADVKLAKNVVSAVQHPHSPETKRFIRSVKDQTVAGVHGAGDAFTFGVADKGSAAVRAVAKSGGDLHKVGELYDQNMDAERAQDAYETENFGQARMAGQVAGTVAQIAALGPLGEAAQIARIGGLAAKALQAEKLANAARVAFAPAAKVLLQSPVGRLAEAAPLIAREKLALTGAGAVSGAVSQGIGDVASGHKSTLGDYLAAAGVGAIQGRLAPRLHPVAGGALGGAGTSAAQDAVDGRQVSFVDALISGAAGGAGSAVARSGGTRWADQLPSNGPAAGPLTKKKLGESISKWRSQVRGHQVVKGPDRYYLDEGGYMRPDHYIDNYEVVEAKLGRKADFTTRQRQALRQGDVIVRSDHTLPEDFGTAFALPGGQTASQVIRDYFDKVTRRPETDWYW